MTPTETLLAKLPGATPSGGGWSAKCPAHDDNRASLSVSEGDDGRALVRCHAGCPAEAIVAAVGLSLRELMPERGDPQPSRRAKPAPRSSGKPTGRAYATPNDALTALQALHGPRTGLWKYHNAVGELVGFVARWDRPDGGKEIRPGARDADGWRVGAMPEPRPLYRLSDLAAAERVAVVEGEKAADAARSIGLTATTSAGGAQAPGKTDWGPLAGKEVWILPDNDAPGRKYADTVAALLAKLDPPPLVRVVELPDLPDKGDIADWIDAHGDAAEPDAMRAEVKALAGAVEPEEPGHPADGPGRFRPFPVDALPEPVRGFVAAGAKAIGCDPSYLALPLLAVLAAAIGNTRRLELKRGWYAPPILWTAIVGESGTAKSPAFKLVMRPARERQRKALERLDAELKRHEADLARWEKEYTAWKRSKDPNEEPPAKPDPPRAERYVVSDTTVEALAPLLLANPRGLLSARDELAGWIGSFDRYAGKGTAGADAANWLSMYDAESIIVDRKTAGPRPIFVPHAAVCVTGGIQPGILQRALGAEHRESGLAARLLLAWPPRRPKAWTEADIDPRAEAALAALFDRLYELRPATTDDGEARPVLVRLTSPAKAAWVAYYGEHAAEQLELSGDMAAAWSKLEEGAARLALVVHLTRWAANDARITDSNALDAESMKAGITLATWFKGEARRVYAMLAESDAEREDRRLAEWVERRGGSATVREAQQGCRWLKEPGTAEAALERLVKAGRGRWLPPTSTPKGGRPPRAFTLSTPSTVYETPATDMARGGSVDVDTVDAPAPASAGPGGGRLFPIPSGLPD